MVPRWFTLPVTEKWPWPAPVYARRQKYHFEGETASRVADIRSLATVTLRLFSDFRVVATGLFVALATAACAKSETAHALTADGQAKAVKVEPVRQETIRRTVEVVGTLAAEDEVTVSSEADGRVSRMLADLGDRVNAGQVLVELDREKLQYSLDQQRAALGRALAKYGATDTEHLPPIEQTPDVQKAQAELVQAKQAYDRAEELHKRQLVPKQTLDDAEATLRSKQASYDSSLQNAKNLRADIDASNAAMKLAERQLRDTSIRAPFDGYVQKRLVSLGEFVKNQTPVMSVVRIDPLKVIAEIPERMAPWIKVGPAGRAQRGRVSRQTITGTVSRISPAVNTQTRAFPLRGARAQRRRAAQARHVRARPHRDGAGRHRC